MHYEMLVIQFADGSMFRGLVTAAFGEHASVVAARVCAANFIDAHIAATWFAQ